MIKTRNKNDKIISIGQKRRRREDQRNRSWNRNKFKEKEWGAGPKKQGGIEGMSREPERGMDTANGFGQERHLKTIIKNYNCALWYIGTCIYAVRKRYFRFIIYIVCLTD
jgi:hypothetical protein